MFHLAEFFIQVAAHPLGRGVGVCHLGMLRLQVLQLMHQEVEFLIADGRLVQHVVTVVVLVQFLAQLVDSLYLVHH